MRHVLLTFINTGAENELKAPKSIFMGPKNTVDLKEMERERPSCPAPEHTLDPSCSVL